MLSWSAVAGAHVLEGSQGRRLCDRALHRSGGPRARVLLVDAGENVVVCMRESERGS